MTATTKDSANSHSSPMRTQRESAYRTQRVNCAPRQSKKQMTSTQPEVPFYESALQKNTLQLAD